MKPNLFIVGAPKCGTTSMASYLAEHKQVCFSSRKEPIYFGRDLDHTWRTKSWEEYLAYFAHYGGEKYLAEGSVWYLYSKTAAEEIHACSPEAKIVVMLRSPVDMIRSLHRQFVSTNNEHLLDLNRAIEAEQQRQRGLLQVKGSHFPEGLLYTRVAAFSQQVDRYLNVFGRDNVHVVLFDDLKSDTLEAYNGVLRFLGLPESESVASLPVHNLAGYQFRTGINVVDRFLRRHRSALEWPLDRAPALKCALKRLLSQVNGYHGQMSPDTRSRLIEKMKPDVEQLSRLIGRDLSRWMVSQ